MADLFRCDHCGALLKKHEKAGTLTLQQHDWRDGVFFGPRTVHNHDLCQRCFGQLWGMIRKMLPEG